MKNIKLFFKNFIFSMKITYQASQLYSVAQILLTAAISVLPFLTIYIWKNIVNLLISSNTTNSVPKIIVYLCIYIAIYGMTQMLGTLNNYVGYKFNDRVNIYMENVLLDKYKNIDLSFYDSGEMQDRLSHASQIKISMIDLSQTGLLALESAIAFIASFLILCTLSVWYAVFCMLLFIPVLMCKLKNNKITIDYEKETAAINRRSEYFKSLFKSRSNIFEIKIFGLKDHFITKFSDAWSQLYKLRKRKTAISMVLMLVGLFFSICLGQILLYIILIYRLIKRIFRVGDASYFISVFNQFHANAENLVDCLMFIQYSFQNTMIVKEFLETQPDVPKSGTVEPVFESKIAFSNVWFKYPGQEKYILEDCSFTLGKDEIVGLVGENGSGKSTIVKLLLRLYDVTKGEITIDGLNIKDCDIVKYRKLFGILFQDYIKYSMTLRENIVLSDWGKFGDEEKIKYAIIQSKLDKIINGWGKSLETPLTQYFEADGKELSSGQWQRIALARTFFQSRAFNVLDEPSASLDVFAEDEIFKKFKNRAHGKGSLIISHRLSTIANANRVMVLKDGKIIEQGSHAELLKMENGYYADLFKMQAKKYIT